MSDPETIPVGTHQEIALLPWYANETLPAAERQQVARHLESCPDCRRELEDLKQMKRDLAAFYESQPVPSSRLARAVFTMVAQEAAARGAPAAGSGSWLGCLDTRVRSFFIPQWVPTLAVLVMVMQFALLLWVTMPQAPPDEVTTRSISSPVANFKVVFQERATEQEVRAVLSAISGRIIDGPDADHAYVIQATAPAGGSADGPLQILRRRADVVRTAEPLTP